MGKLTLTKNENILADLLRSGCLMLGFIFLSSNMFGQEHPLYQINQDVYIPFSQAYAKSDIALFKSIHSKELIRIGSWSKKIRGFDEYMDGYEKRWSNPDHETSYIEFRFLERIYSDSLASERGIYRVTRNKNSPDEKSDYGKFHVLLTKEAGKWKFLMDYDSNEGNTINADSYQKAFPIDEVHHFIRKP